jgi:hypothetical protein
MPLTEKQTHLACIIDKCVKETIRNGGDDRRGGGLRQSGETGYLQSFLLQ